MIGIFQYRHGALRPADAHTIEMCGRFKQGEILKAEPKRMRNPKQLALWWAMAGVMAEHADWCTTKEDASDWIKISIGYFKLIRSPDGKEWPRPKSIAFGNCDQTEFDQILTKAIAVICERVIPGTPNEILRAELEAMVMPIGPDAIAAASDSKPKALDGNLYTSVQRGNAAGDDWQIIATDIVNLIDVAGDFDRLAEIDAIYAAELAEMEKHAPTHYASVTHAMQRRGEELNRQDGTGESAKPAQHPLEAG